MPRQSKHSIERRPAIEAFRRAVGERMRLARLSAGVSQKECAAVLGVNSSVVSKTERGEQLPSVLVIAEYVRRFTISADYLLFGPESDHAEAVEPPEVRSTRPPAS